jgi:hypothetical protein
MRRGSAVVALQVLASAFLSFASLFSFAALSGKEALAQGAPAPTVVLLSLTKSDDVTTEAMARVKGELKAAGFDVAIVPFSGGDARRDLEAAGRELNAIAAFAIFVRPFEGGTSVAEIWVSDRIRQKIVIQNAVLHETDRGRGSEILAVRAVELLKANLADFWAPAASPPPAPPPPPSPPPTPPAPESEHKPRPPFASGLGAGLGVGILESFGAMGATWSPNVAVSYGWPRGLSVRATFAGLGPAAVFTASNGSADVEQELALLEIVKTWWPGSALVPLVSVGSGAQHVHVAGTGNPPYQGHTSDRWSLVTTVGAGIAIPIVSTLSILVQARALAAWPSAVVQVVGADVARVGAPSLLADGGLFGTIP